MQRQRFPFVFTSDMAELLVAKSSSVESDASPGSKCLNMLQEFEELCGRAFNAVRVRWQHTDPARCVLHSHLRYQCVAFDLC